MAVFYLKWIVPGTIIIPMLTFVLRFKAFPHALRILFFYLLISSLINVIALALETYYHSNLWLLHIYTIIETIFLLFFFSSISPSLKIKKVTRVLVWLFPAICILNLLLFQPASRFNSYPRSAEALLFIFLAISYWVGSQETKAYDTWAANPYNWIISGLLLYFSSSFVLFLFSDIMLTAQNLKPSAELMRMISLAWVIHGTLIIIQYIFFTIGFSKYKK